jgi:hypothetical protein
MRHLDEYEEDQDNDKLHMNKSGGYLPIEQRQHRLERETDETMDRANLDRKMSTSDERLYEPLQQHERVESDDKLDESRDLT